MGFLRVLGNLLCTGKIVFFSGLSKGNHIKKGLFLRDVSRVKKGHFRAPLNNAKKMCNKGELYLYLLKPPGILNMVGKRHLSRVHQ